MSIGTGLSHITHGVPEQLPLYAIDVWERGPVVEVREPRVADDASNFFLGFRQYFRMQCHLQDEHEERGYHLDVTGSCQQRACSELKPRTNRVRSR